MPRPSLATSILRHVHPLPRPSLTTSIVHNLNPSTPLSLITCIPLHLHPSSPPSLITSTLHYHLPKLLTPTSLHCPSFNTNFPLPPLTLSFSHLRPALAAQWGSRHLIAGPFGVSGFWFCCRPVWLSPMGTSVQSE